MEKKEKRTVDFCLPLSSEAATRRTAGRRIGFVHNTKRKTCLQSLILMDVEQVTRQQVFPDQRNQGVKWGLGVGGGCGAALQ